MKKSFVFLLLALAVVVLVSPRIVGRLAEQSMDQNLDWAATESQEVTITSLGFDRGWFSSAGQHRIELREGELRDSLMLLAFENGLTELPVLVIDTHIDHGLVAVTSMTREKGTLAPGLGSAVSTMKLELEDGTTLDIPGTIYSNLSLTGALTSNLVMDPGSYTGGAESVHWGNIDVAVTTSATVAAIAIDGQIDELVFASPTEEFSFNDMIFVGEHRPTAFGFGIGDADISVGSITIPSTFGTDTIGPVQLNERIWLDDDEVSAHGTVALNDIPFGPLDRANIIIDVAIEGADAGAVGRISKKAAEFDGYGNEWILEAENDILALLANGFELRIDQLDVELPRGTLSATIDATLEPGDPDQYYIDSALTLLDASLDLSVPAEVMEYISSVDPQTAAAIAVGYFRLEGNSFKLNAELRDGRLSVNDAPMPIPWLSGN